ncbi:MAG: hypothetical protein E7604_09865 [Ruminococcaceae bacterium]|nr:hypothetical protein [Oscillospiraceae bacterium]
MNKRSILILLSLFLLLICGMALIAIAAHHAYFSIIPDTEKTYSGTIIDTALYPQEITEVYSTARSQIGIDLDVCEECSICYNHYFTVSKHCTDSCNRGESVILTVAKERGTGMYVVTRIVPQNKDK